MKLKYSKRFRIKMILASAFLLILFAGASSAQIVRLPIQKETQETGRWCWAASMTMILNRYRTSYPEYPTDTVNEDCTTLGQCCVVNLYKGGNPSCCPSYEVGGEEDPCYIAGSNLDDALEDWGVDATQINDSLSTVEVDDEIDAERPFIIEWEWTGSEYCDDLDSGHAVVGAGFDQFSNYMQIIDPTTRTLDNGYTWAHITWVWYGYSEGKDCYHDWVRTVTVDNSPSSSTVRLRCVDPESSEKYNMNQDYTFTSPGDIIAGDSAEMKEFEIVGGANVIFETDTSHEIYLQKGFRVESGSKFRARRE
jgi:hypothetical protein